MKLQTSTPHQDDEMIGIRGTSQEFRSTLSTEGMFSFKVRCILCQMCEGEVMDGHLSFSLLSPRRNPPKEME